MMWWSMLLLAGALAVLALAWALGRAASQADDTREDDAAWDAWRAHQQRVRDRREADDDWPGAA